MRLLELTLDSPAANLALDEALFLQLEEDPAAGETLRLWESPSPFVVLGRSARRAEEVNLAACHERGVPVLRRCSGGGTVLAGPGCLMYAVVLSLKRLPNLRSIPAAHQHVMQRIASAVQSAGVDCRIEGISDLARDGRKFSGNALRVGRAALLYHGTLLHRMTATDIAAVLGTPARQPAWRQSRSHEQFVTTIEADPASLRTELARVWNASPGTGEWPADRVADLIQRRYGTAQWNEHP